MEALRNYAQHRDVPLHSVGHQATAVGDLGSERLLRHGFTARISIERLESDGGFKTAVLKELRGHARHRDVDVRPFARAYLSALGRIHVGLRSELLAKLDKSSEIIESTIVRYAEEAEGETSALAAVARDSSGHNVRVVYLGTKLSTRRKELSRRHASAQHFEQMYVSSESDLQGA